MRTLKEIEQPNHEKVVYFEDTKTNLKAIIAIHSTILGPSLGGCRMMNYSNEKNALSDVLRLSEGMTYKAAMADLKLGGGKAVILALQNEISKNKNCRLAEPGEFTKLAFQNGKINLLKAESIADLILSLIHI